MEKIPYSQVKKECQNCKNDLKITGKRDIKRKKFCSLTCLEEFKKRKFDENEKRILENFFIDGNVKNCSKRLNYRKDWIYEILRRNDIKSHLIDQRKYKIDDDYFNKIDTPNSAYILGLIFTDGCHTGYQIQLALSEGDKYILEDINLELKSNRPLKHRLGPEVVSSTSGKIYQSKDTYCLIMRSKQICDNMLKYGVTPRKSKTVKFPTWINPELSSHFIRGVMDGDGCISKSIRSGRKEFRVELASSSPDFSYGFKDFIEKQLDIQISIKSFDGNFKAGIYKEENQKIFLDWIYQDKTLFLKRKFDRYMEFINNLTEKRKNKSSKYKGVSYHKRAGKWIATKQVNKKRVLYGAFDTEIEAAKAYGHQI